METLKRRRVADDEVGRDVGSENQVENDQQAQEPLAKTRKYSVEDDYPENFAREVQTVVKSSGVALQGEANLRAVASPGRDPLVIDHLGNELVIKVFSYLPTRDLLRAVCRVNRKWYKLSRAPELWRHVVLDVNKLRLKEGMDYRPKLITDPILLDLTSRSQGILSVDLTDCNALSAGTLGG